MLPRGLSRFLFFTTLVSCGYLQAQSLSWNIASGYQVLRSSPNIIIPDHGIYTDTSGNVYVAGSTLGTIDPSQTAYGDYDFFLAKYDSSGNQLWITQFGTPSPDLAAAVYADSSGNVYVGGLTSGSFSGFTNAGGWDFFIAEYNSSGGQLWIEQGGSTQNDTLSAITVDPSGNVAITGTTMGAIVSGGASSGGIDIYAAEYNQSGSQSWIQQFGSSGDDEPSAITTDSNGNVYIAGYSNGTMVSGGTNYGGYDAFLAQYTPAGSQAWLQQFGTSAFDGAQSVTVDNNGNVYVAGDTMGVLGSNVTASFGGYDVFLAQFDTSGDQNWIQQFGTPQTDVPYSVNTDSSNTVYISGATFGSFITGVSNPTAGNGQGFIATYNSSGASVGFEQYGLSGYICGHSLAVDASGDIYEAGYATGTVEAGAQGLVFQLEFTPGNGSAAPAERKRKSFEQTSLVR